MRTEIVTSFSVEGAALYGLRCVESASDRWPHSFVVYGDEPMFLDGVETRLTTEIPSWNETRESLPHTRPDARTTGSDKWTRKPASYLWDAKRFAVKPFVWLDAAEGLERGILVWLDGDTVTTREVEESFVSDVLGDADVAYLGRGDMHPETGIVVFRIPEALPLLEWCRDTYQHGWFRTMADGWTDCHVLRAGLKSVPVKARDLTSHLCGEWSSAVDAVALSPFGPYVSHLKGSRKLVTA
jgi:hypothetical protein